MDVMINAHGLQNGIHRIPYWLQGRGEGGIGAGAVSYCNGGAATAVTLQAPKGDPEIAEEWTTAQHAILEELLKKYESDPPVIRYAKIRLRLPGKKITDVAFRCKWMTDVSLDMKGVLRQEESKHVKKETRKRNDDSLSRKRKNKKVKATDSSAKTSCHLPVQPNGTPNSMQMLHMDTDNDISYKAIGDPTGLLLEHTAELLNQISGNLTNFQLNDNIGLLFQARDSILEAMKDRLHDIPPEMQRMPPFRFMLNEELANSILPCIIPQTALQS